MHALAELERRGKWAALRLVWVLLRPAVVTGVAAAVLLARLATSWPFRGSGGHSSPAPLGLRSKLLAAVAFVAWLRSAAALLRDTVYRQLWLATDRPPVATGATTMARILQRAGLLGGTANGRQSNYRPPFWMLTGDWTTILATILHRPLPPSNTSEPTLRTHRSFVPVVSEEEESQQQAGGRPTTGDVFCLDWSFPSHGKPIKGVVVMLAGVGGDAKSPYMQDMARAAADRAGLCTVVCVPRGLADSVPVGSLEALFDPSDLRDLHRAVEVAAAAAVEIATWSAKPGATGGAETIALSSSSSAPQMPRVPEETGKAAGSSTTAPVFIVGFSMGACMLCRYLGEYGAAGRVPEAVRAGVAVSGAMKLDFMRWRRYESVYQPVIVPSLLSTIIRKYGGTLLRSGSGGGGGDSSVTAGSAAGDDGRVSLERLLACTTYKDLYEAVYKQRDRTRSFEAWKASMEGAHVVSGVDRPLLVLSAADDPLHHPGLIGFPPTADSRATATTTSTAAATTTASPNPNVAFWLTRYGGHVAWPTTTPASDGAAGAGYDFRWLTEVVLNFCEAAEAEKTTPAS